MSELKVTGKIYKVFETVQVSDSFKKREFVVETDDNYPQLVKFELTQDNCSKADGLKEGQAVQVSFNIRGREWTSPKNEVKYFNTLQAWRIETLQQGESAGAMPSAGQEPTTETFADDLPF